MEQISLMKPKGEGEHDTGLLEYLSDIIGVSHYEQALKNLSVECGSPSSCPSTAHVHTLSIDRPAPLRAEALAGSAVLESLRHLVQILWLADDACCSTHKFWMRGFMRLRPAKQ